MRFQRTALAACFVAMLEAGTVSLGGAFQRSDPAPADTVQPGTLVALTLMGSHEQVVVGLRGDAVLSGVIQEITGPFRLFVDFENVVPAVEPVTTVGRGGVERVRVALNQSSPPVTRVVLDLSRQSTYRVERDADNQEFRIIVGSASTAALPNAVSVPTSDTPVSTPTAALAANYTRWFGETTQEMERLLGDSGADQPAGPTQAPDRGFQEWQLLQHEVNMTTPPLSLQAAHDLLKTAVNLGFFGTGEDATRPSSTATAAHAGATMLLSRARALVDAHATPATIAGQQ